MDILRANHSETMLRRIAIDDHSCRRLPRIEAGVDHHLARVEDAGAERVVDLVPTTAANVA